MNWKMGLHGRPESNDGRFYIERYSVRKSRPYTLVDTKTDHRERGSDIECLKTMAKAIILAERPTGCDVDPLG